MVAGVIASSLILVLMVTYEWKVYKGGPSISHLTHAGLKLPGIQEDYDDSSLK